MAFATPPCLGIHPRHDQYGLRHFIPSRNLWRLAKTLRAGRVPDLFGTGLLIYIKRPEHDLGPFIHTMIDPQNLFVRSHPRCTFVREGRQSRARIGLCVHDPCQDRLGIGTIHSGHILDVTDPRTNRKIRER